jgi:hypothetical protein
MDNTNFSVLTDKQILPLLHYLKEGKLNTVFSSLYDGHDHSTFKGFVIFILYHF